MSPLLLSWLSILTPSLAGPTLAGTEMTLHHDASTALWHNRDLGRGWELQVTPGPVEVISPGVVGDGVGLRYRQGSSTLRYGVNSHGSAEVPVSPGSQPFTLAAFDDLTVPGEDRFTRTVWEAGPEVELRRFETWPEDGRSVYVHFTLHNRSEETLTDLLFQRGIDPDQDCTPNPNPEFPSDCTGTTAHTLNDVSGAFATAEGPLTGIVIAIGRCDQAPAELGFRSLGFPGSNLADAAPGPTNPQGALDDLLFLWRHTASTLGPGEEIDAGYTIHWSPTAADLQASLATHADLCRSADRDGDGYRGPMFDGDDCDDDDPNVNPGAVEIPGDGIDNDCSGFDAPLPEDTGLPDTPQDTSDPVSEQDEDRPEQDEVEEDGPPAAEPSPADDTDGPPPRWVVTGGHTTNCQVAPSAPSLLTLGGLALLTLLRRRRVQPRPWTGFALLILALSVAAPAHAQMSPGLNIQRFEPSGFTSGFANVRTARFLPSRRVEAMVLGNYAWRPLQRSIQVGNSLIRDAGAVEHLTAAHLYFGVGATPWFQIAVHAPVVQFINTEIGLDSLGGVRSVPYGFGDVFFEFGFRPLGEDKGVGLAILPFVSIPSGSRDSFLTHGVPTFGGRLALSGQAGPVHLAIQGGYRAKIGNATLLDRVAVDDEVLYGAGIGLYMIPDELRFNLELSGVSIVGSGLSEIRKDLTTGRLHTPLEANANLHGITRSGFSLLIGGGIGITPAPGTPAARGFLGLGYAPPAEKDRDGDGIPDHLDQCPNEPEDFDGFQDEDGCPDPDNDGDGIPDHRDQCPDEPEDFDGFQDEDGCPDPDNDGDGIPDHLDQCPDEPEDFDGFEDEDGCPDPDNDGDGILDVDDLCPDEPEDFDGFYDDDGCPETEHDRDGDGIPDALDPCPDDPEDFDGFQDDDGCPEPDNDEDGIPDVDDLCPNEPEDFDGFEDEDGCPDPDNDGDGIPDHLDECPNEPETFNDYMDEDGCPDTAPAELKGDRIEINDRILFYVNEARLKEESYPVLEAVFSILERNPQVRRIRIEGHTDSQGRAAYNQDLSERRALSVRQYLIDRGLSPSRLVAQGFGQSFPIAPNSTPEGRAQNRRVEFVVLDQGEGKPPPPDANP